MHVARTLLLLVALHVSNVIGQSYPVNFGRAAPVRVQFPLYGILGSEGRLRTSSEGQQLEAENFFQVSETNVLFVMLGSGGLFRPAAG